MAVWGRFPICGSQIKTLLETSDAIHGHVEGGAIGINNTVLTMEVFDDGTGAAQTGPWLSSFRTNTCWQDAFDLWSRPGAGAELARAVRISLSGIELGQPVEVADLVLFLSSSASDLITGETVMIDGGYTAL